MNPSMFYRSSLAAFILFVGLSFAGWNCYFRESQQSARLKAEKEKLEQEVKDVCADLNELRASVAAGLTITF